MPLRPSCEPYLSSHGKGLPRATPAASKRERGHARTFSAACEARACVRVCLSRLSLSANTNCVLCVCAFKNCLLLCTSSSCVCVCVCLSVANYPCYKYKIPIRHCVSGWLQRRHNWFQMVTQIFPSLQRLCVRESRRGEPVGGRKAGEGLGRGEEKR